MFKRFMLMLAIAFTLIGAAMPVAWAGTPEHSETRVTALARWVQAVTKEKVSFLDATKIVKTAYQYGKTHNVDPLLILSIIRSESTFNRKASARHGSRGLMQVIPFWHRDKIRGRDIFNTEINVDVGTQVLDKCLEKGKGIVRAALFCFRGAKDTKYVAKIASTHQEMRRYIVEYEYTNEQPITSTLAFDKGRIYSESEHQLAMQELAPAG